MTEDRRIEPPPHLLKQWVQAAREAEKKGGPYAKTFAMAAIEWALNSQPTPNDRQIRSSEITPPPELVRKWQIKIEYCSKRADREAVVAKIFQLGADKELEACCEWLPKLPPWSADDLRRHRRPKPPNLKERALRAWAAVEAGTDDQTAMAVIRRALEQLDD